MHHFSNQFLYHCASQYQFQWWVSHWYQIRSTMTSIIVKGGKLMIWYFKYIYTCLSNLFTKNDRTCLGIDGSTFTENITIFHKVCVNKIILLVQKGLLLTIEVTNKYYIKGCRNLYLARGWRKIDYVMISRQKGYKTPHSYVFHWSYRSCVLLYPQVFSFH